MRCSGWNRRALTEADPACAAFAGNGGGCYRLPGERAQLLRAICQQNQMETEKAETRRLPCVAAVARPSDCPTTGQVSCSITHLCLSSGFLWTSSLELSEGWDVPFHFEFYNGLAGFVEVGARICCHLGQAVIHWERKAAWRQLQSPARNS